MNENLNLCEILKHCPAGTKFWSPVWGDVFLVEIKERIEGKAYMPIVIKAFLWDSIFLFSNGRCTDEEGAECVIFPSKNQHDWSKFKGPKFDPTDLKPFDKVLIKRPGGQWGCDFFSDISLEPENEKVYCTGMIGYECIPYNDETKHLVATSDDCPDYYKWWEE
jgi:hypothetical protein